jgi:hypothetical protein
MAVSTGAGEGKDQKQLKRSAFRQSSAVNKPAGRTCQIRKKGVDMTKLDCRIECSIQITLFTRPLSHQAFRYLFLLIS